MTRELRLWKAYATLTTLLLGALVVMAFRQSNTRDFDQINVHRVNIVGPDGALQMTISNRQDQPEGRMDGKTFTSQGRHEGAGLIFYNSLGDEDGGLTFGAHKTAGGYSADAGLMFDQFKQDQTVGLTYSGENGQQTSGLRVWERPATDLAQEAEHFEAVRAMSAGAAKTAALAQLHKDAEAGKFGSERLFAGRMPSEAAVVVLNDQSGHPRLRMEVAPDGTPMIEFLDASGKVVRKLAAQP
ncbi:MAG: hypothetical protein ACRD1C_06685 [Terriglobales bacterium]